MLTEEERREIEEEAGHYEQKRAASIEAMMVVQRHRGWVSDESLEEIGRLLDMSTADLDGVATFYNLIFRKPVGRHVIFICNSVSCWVMGYEAVRQHLMDRLGITLGGTTADGRFTLLPIVCLGACDRAPAMMVDDELHGPLTPERIDDILEKYV